MSGVESPTTSPKARKLSKKLLSFSVKKTPKVETPAYRFMVSCQGHGYPVPLPTTHATAAPAAASTKAGLLNLLKRDHHAKPAAKTPTAPAYRFISSMAGYGCPYPTDATPLPKAGHKAEKMAAGISLKMPFVSELTHALKKEKTPTVPAHRFMVSCQGHGYPVPESTVTPASPTPRRKTAAALLGMLKREPTVGSKPTPVAAPEAPAVPAYRFISTMAGNGCPMPTDATPLPAAKADKPHHAKSAMGGILGGISSVFKRTTHAPALAEEPAAPAEATEAAAAPAPAAPEVPAYRFIVSMQGHGCPVPVSTAPIGSPEKKKAKKGFLSSILSIFSKPKAQTAAVGQA